MSGINALFWPTPIAAKIIEKTAIYIPSVPCPYDIMCREKKIAAIQKVNPSTNMTLPRDKP